MSPGTPKISLADLGEVFFTSTELSRSIRRFVAAGQARQIQGRLYTKNLDDPVEDIVRRRVWDVVAGYFHGAVLVDRTAFELQPLGDEGSVFLSWARPSRTITLPGLRVVCRSDAGPVEGDTPFLNSGLFLSSWARRFLDNVRPSRARTGVRRTLMRAELEGKLRDVLVRQGEDQLNRIRDEARSIADALDAADELQDLDDLIGTLLGTRSGALETADARAIAAGRGWDDRRLPLFDALAAKLQAYISADRPATETSTGQTFAFYESYFSNFIEGTEFTIEEARTIVFDGLIPEQRPADGHDIAGTFDLVVDRELRVWVASDAAELERILRVIHQRIMVGRPETQPGTFKAQANRAGSTEFVDPSLVEGTLRRGWERYEHLPPGFARAVFAMFLVAEVHPFIDGNGRVARAVANAEMTAAGQQRVIIPTVYRDDYLQALRALSRNADPTPLVRVMDRAQAWTSEVDWSSLDAAQRDLEVTNALMPSHEADAAGVILRLPSEARGLPKA